MYRKTEYDPNYNTATSNGKACVSKRRISLSGIGTEAASFCKGRIGARLLLAAGCIMCISLYAPYFQTLNSLAETASLSINEVQSQYGLSGITDNTLVVCASSSDISDDGWFDIIITDSGVDKSFACRGGSVAQVLSGAGIAAPDNDDVITPSLEELCTADTHIIIDRVSYEEYVSVEAIPFETVKHNNSSIEKGETSITTLGSDGEKRVVYQRKWVNGEIESEVVLSETVTREPVTEIMEIGTSKTTSSEKKTTTTTETKTSATEKKTTSATTEKTTSATKSTTSSKKTSTTAKTTTTKATTTSKTTTTTTAKKTTTTKNTTTTVATTAATEAKTTVTAAVPEQTEATTTTTASTTAKPTTTTTEKITSTTTTTTTTAAGSGNSSSGSASDKVFTDSSGRKVSYSKVLKGVGTAYTDKPGALTSTGRKVEQGIVAVDPKVIPYNTRLYIVSADGKYVYGYALAADTGSALRSGKVLVDLFYDTESKCVAFGRRDVIVYVL